MSDEIRSSAFAGSAPVRGWRAAFPPAQWLAAYRPQWLANDAIAGATLAAYGIPVSLAYATLAGLPPQSGIYQAITHIAARSSTSSARPSCSASRPARR